MSMVCISGNLIGYTAVPLFRMINLPNVAMTDPVGKAQKNFQTIEVFTNEKVSGTI